MRTLPTILKTALANGTGTPIVRLKVYNRGTTPTYWYQAKVMKYEMTRFTCKVWIEESGYVHGEMFKLERGLKINGVEYLVSSPWLYFMSTTFESILINGVADYDRQVLTLSMWEIGMNYNASTSANVSAATAIGNVMSIACAAHFHASETWYTWQYEKAGTNLNLKAFSGLLPQLWNKYTAKMFPRDDGYILFKSQYSLINYYNSGEIADTDIYLPFTIDQITYNRSDGNVMGSEWNLFWEDETGATHRLSTYYPALVGRKLRNIGFLPSTASKAELLFVATNQSLYGNAASTDTITTRINFEVEQGDLVYAHDANADVALTLIASLTESYNMGGTRYPWQTKIQGERMWFNGQGS